jgi:basic membrane protein A
MVVAACGGGGTATNAPSQGGGVATPAAGSPAASAAAKNWIACVAFDTGGLGDKGFNDLAKKGLDDAGAAGFTTYFSEAKGSTDYANNIQSLIDKGCQSIVTVGFLQTNATIKKAAENTDIAFAQVDTSWGCGPDFKCGTADDTEPANYTGLDYQVDQAAMLAGYLAGSWTKTGKVGTYGGLAFPGVTRFMDGLYAGVQYYNKQKSKNVQVLGWDGSQKDPTKTGTFVGGAGDNSTWGNPAKGKQLAQNFIDQGVDIVHPVAGATGNGTIEAMFNAHKWAIGVDTDQYISIGPPTNGALLTSAQKAIDVSVVDFFKSSSSGNLGGKDYEGTLANNGVLLAPFHDYDSQIPQATKDEIEALRQAIISGQVQVCQFLGRGCS